MSKPDAVAASQVSAGAIPNDPLLSVGGAASCTGTTERLWRRMIDERRIEFTKVGKYVRIRKSVIDEYLEANTVRPSRAAQ